MERREVEETATANAYFLPETLNVSGNVETQMLHRGIYDAVVYRAQTTLSGKFAPPDFGPLKIDLKDVQWKDAFVTIAINDLRGTREAIVLDWGGTKHPMLPGSQVPGYTTGATAPLGSDQPIAAEIQFSIPLDFNGSEGIFFAPFGVQNEATLKSNWPDLGFRGAFLPAERSVCPDGFDAKWKVSYYGRDYPQSWTSRDWQRAFHHPVGFEFAFRRAVPVDPGRVSLRRTLDQIRRAVSGARFHGVLSLRNHRATENSSVSISDGRRSALFVLSAAIVDFGIYRIQLGLSDRGSCLDSVDHLVLPLFPGWRCAHVHDRRRIGRRLPVSLHHFAATGLRPAHGRNRALHRAGDRDVRDAQSRLVRA